MPKITPFLWFNGQAEEAANFYISLFKNSKILNVVRSPVGAPGPADTVMVVAFELDGAKFTALNGGPNFSFTEAISFVVNCEDQDEVDHFWNSLSNGRHPGQCGWLKDKFGLSWQIVPKVLRTLMSDPDPVKSGRVMQAMMGMEKIIITDLQKAYDQN